MPQIATTKLKVTRKDTGVQEDYNPGDLVPHDDDLVEDTLPLLESGAIAEGEVLSDTPSGDGMRIIATARLEKYNAADDLTADERMLSPDHGPDEVIEGTPNALTIGGASAVIELLIGGTFTNYSSANAHLGVSDATTAFANTDTATTFDAGTNKTRKPATVSHTDSVSSGTAAVLTLVSTFATTDANHRWRSWGILNASSSGRLLSRKVEDLDGGSAKTSAQAWQLTVTWTLTV